MKLEPFPTGYQLVALILRRPPWPRPEEDRGAVEGRVSRCRRLGLGTSDLSEFRACRTAEQVLFSYPIGTKIVRNYNHVLVRNKFVLLIVREKIVLNRDREFVLKLVRKNIKLKPDCDFVPFSSH